MNCPSCNAELPTHTTVRFCPFCGSKFEAVAKDTKPETAAAPAEEVDEQDKPTVINMPAITQEEMASVLDAPEPEDEDFELPTGAGGGAGDDGDFSETAWFMSAQSPEELLDAEGEALDYSEQDVMTDRYRRKETLPDEVRKDFSLSEDVHKKRSRARSKKKRK